MGTRNPNKEDPEAIRMVFQRLCESESAVKLTFGTFQGDFRVLAEAPDRIVLGLSDLERGQWRLKPGSHLSLRLLDRGLSYEAVVDFEGHGHLHQVAAAVRHVEPVERADLQVERARRGRRGDGGPAPGAPAPPGPTPLRP